MSTILLIIWIHYIADFLLQPRYIAEHKSTDVRMLFFHCILYSLPFYYFGWKFALVAGSLHFIIDFPSSRIIRYYWYKEKKFLAFGLIGLDQACHMTCLLLTMGLI